MTTSARPSRRNTRRQYKLSFSPYLWVKTLDMATPTLHVVAEVIADVVDPDGGHCWLTYDTIAERACHVGRSSVDRAIKTLCAFSVARKVQGDDRLQILDAAGARYNPKQPPTVLELLIPASAYSPQDLARINLMRSDRGLPAITPESRPDITGLIGELPKSRSDKGQAAPQRRRKDVREAQAAFEEQQPSLYSVQDTAEPPEDPFEDSPGTHPPMSERHGPLCLSDTPPHVSETPNPYELHPRDADPDSIPSGGAQPQGQEPAGRDTDGADESEGDQDDDQAPTEPGHKVEASPAELVVDGLLRDTADTAQPLSDPTGDRKHLIALAQAALDRGMSSAQLRSITSVGLHNVRKQWALTARLTDPEAFAQVKQPSFGRPMGGPEPATTLHPRCPQHPTCSTLDAQGRCAECAEDERLRALEEGEIVEYRYDARDGLWRDHTGAIIEEFEDMDQDQVEALVTEREQNRAQKKEASRQHAAAAADTVRQKLQASRTPSHAPRRKPAGLAGILEPPQPGEVVEKSEGDTEVFPGAMNSGF